MGDMSGIGARDFDVHRVKVSLEVANADQVTGLVEELAPIVCEANFMAAAVKM
jgi:hypothetical protein